jgi:aspartate aminotransferase
MFNPAARMRRIVASPSTMAAQRARELKAQGHDIVTLTTGEPDFPTPDHVIEAAYKAMRAGQTRYTTVSGTAELKAAVIEKFRRENGLTYTADEIMVGAGGKQILFNAFMATVEAGVEVVISAPYWISYPEIVQLAGGTPVFVACDAASGFKLTPARLEAAIKPRTRWLVINQPSNPSGVVYSADELKALGAVLERHPHVAVMCDDIYEHILYDGRTFATLAQVCPSLKDRTVTLNGASKTYAMTGWRIGYCGAPKALVTEMIKLQSQSTAAACSISQAAAVAALTGPQGFVAERTAAFEGRRDLVVSMLNQAKGLTCRSPEGAFYVFPGCQALLGKRTPKGRLLENDRDVVLYLLDEAGVAVVQGSAYGMPGHFRISFATSEKDLIEACERIQRACAAVG